MVLTPVFSMLFHVHILVPGGAVRPALFNMSHVEPVVVSAGLASEFSYQYISFTPNSALCSS